MYATVPVDRMVSLVPDLFEQMRLDCGQKIGQSMCCAKGYTAAQLYLS